MSTGLPNSEWFRQLADGSTIVFFALRVQPDLAFEFLGDAIEIHIGCPAAEALADPRAALDQIDPAHADRFAEGLTLPPGEDSTMEFAWRHRDGRPVYTRIWYRSRRRDDGSVVLEGTVRDITQLHEAEVELQQSEQRHRLLAENAWDVIWTMALDGTITYVSPAVERVRGFTPGEAMSQSLEEIHPPESADSVRAYYERLFAAIAAGTDPPVFRGEHEYYRKDGSIMTGELQVIPHVDADGRVVQILGVTRDVSERRQFEAELRRLAVTDEVTGLWNRRHGEELLAAELADARAAGRPMALLMLDIDHFKSINDRHGHQGGDDALVEVSRRLRDSLPGTDMVSRWGGDEFVVLLRDCRIDEGLTVADKIRGRIADTAFESFGLMTVSVGAAELQPGDDLDTWLARADEALYKAKRSGRNAVRAY